MRKRAPATSPSSNALVADCVRDAPTAYWLDKLETADIPCGPVNPLAELPTDGHLAAVDFFPLTEHPSEGPIRVVRPPVRFGGADCAMKAPGPRLGPSEGCSVSGKKSTAARCPSVGNSASG